MLWMMMWCSRRWRSFIERRVSLMSGRSCSRAMSRRALLLKTLHATLHQVDLKSQAVDLIGLPCSAFYLTCKDVKVTRIMLLAIRRRREDWSRAQFRLDLLEHCEDTAHLVLQPPDRVTESDNIPLLRLEHAGIVGGLGLQARDGTCPYRMWFLVLLLS